MVLVDELEKAVLNEDVDKVATMLYSNNKYIVKPLSHYAHLAYKNIKILKQFFMYVIDIGDYPVNDHYKKLIYDQDADGKTLVDLVNENDNFFLKEYINSKKRYLNKYYRSCN